MGRAAADGSYRCPCRIAWLRKRLATPTISSATTRSARDWKTFRRPARKPHVRVVFLGLPLAACLLAADGHEIALAALSRTDTPGRRRIRRVLGDEKVLDRPKLDARFVKTVRDLAPDLV